MANYNSQPDRTNSMRQSFDQVKNHPDSYSQTNANSAPKTAPRSAPYTAPNSAPRTAPRSAPNPAASSTSAGPRSAPQSGSPYSRQTPPTYGPKTGTSQASSTPRPTGSSAYSASAQGYNEEPSSKDSTIDSLINRMKKGKQDGGVGTSGKFNRDWSERRRVKVETTGETDGVKKSSIFGTPAASSANTSSANTSSTNTSSTKGSDSSSATESTTSTSTSTATKSQRPKADARSLQDKAKVELYRNAINEQKDRLWIVLVAPRGSGKSYLISSLLSNLRQIGTSYQDGTIPETIDGFDNPILENSYSVGLRTAIDGSLSGRTGAIKSTPTRQITCLHQNVRNEDRQELKLTFVDISGEDIQAHVSKEVQIDYLDALTTADVPMLWIYLYDVAPGMISRWYHSQHEDLGVNIQKADELYNSATEFLGKYSEQEVPVKVRDYLKQVLNEVYVGIRFDKDSDLKNTQRYINMAATEQEKAWAAIKQFTSIVHRQTVKNTNNAHQMLVLSKFDVYLQLFDMVNNVEVPRPANAPLKPAEQIDYELGEFNQQVQDFLRHYGELPEGFPLANIALINQIVDNVKMSHDDIFEDEADQIKLPIMAHFSARDLTYQTAEKQLALNTVKDFLDNQQYVIRGTSAPSTVPDMMDYFTEVLEKSVNVPWFKRLWSAFSFWKK